MKSRGPAGLSGRTTRRSTTASSASSREETERLSDAGGHLAAQPAGVGCRRPDGAKPRRSVRRSRFIAPSTCSRERDVILRALRAAIRILRLDFDRAREMDVPQCGREAAAAAPGPMPSGTERVRQPLPLAHVLPGGPSARPRPPRPDGSGAPARGARGWRFARSSPSRPSAPAFRAWRRPVAPSSKAADWPGVRPTLSSEAEILFRRVIFTASAAM